MFQLRLVLIILFACWGMPGELRAQTCNTEENIKTCIDRVGNLATLIKSDSAGRVLQWGMNSSDRHKEASDAVWLIGTTIQILVPNSDPSERADALLKIIGEAETGHDTGVVFGDFRWKAVISGPSLSVVAVRIVH